MPAVREPTLIDTDTAVELFGLANARALRNWHAQGMPYRMMERRVFYPIPDASVWHIARAFLIKHSKWRGNTQLTLDRAYRIAMHIQACHGEPVVLVPLYHDHPARARLLAMATQGRVPPREVNDDAAPSLSDADLDVWEPTPRGLDV